MDSTGDSAHFRTIRGYQLAAQPENGLTPALEDYLEMIGRLCLQHGYTRVGKLGEQLQVRPPSASRMVRKLRELGYVQLDGNDSIQLSESGREIAAFLLHRHAVVEGFLTLLGVADPLEEAEKLEHSLKPDTVLRLEKLLDFFGANPGCKAFYLQERDREGLGGEVTGDASCR